MQSAATRNASARTAAIADSRVAPYDITPGINSTTAHHWPSFSAPTIIGMDSIVICSIDLSATLLKPYADAVFLAAVEQFQVFHFLVLHGEREEARDRLFDLLFGQHLGVQEFLERVLLVAVLHGGLHAAGVGASAGAHSAAPDRKSVV